MWSDAEDDLFDDFTDIGAAAGDPQADNAETGVSSQKILSQRSFAGNAHTNEFQDTQRRDRVIVDYNTDNGETIEPSNEFEKMLLRDGIEIRSDENYKKYMYIGDTTSDLLVAKLDKNMNVRRYKDDLLNAFEEALQERSNLVIYLEASHSSCGLQESIFRVLILCRLSQAKAFDLLMSQLENLQKEGPTNTNLSHLCIAQIRFINRIFDSHALFCSVFEREIEIWIPEIRNSLISSIPEILTDLSVRIEAVQELHSLLLREVKTDPVGCKLAVISALSLLDSDAEAARKFQTKVMQLLNSFDVELLPPLIELLLRRVDSSNKNAFANLLTQFSANLRIDGLRPSRRIKVRRTLDDIVGEIFEKITQFVVLGGDSRWKEVQRFLRNVGVVEKGAGVDIASQESMISQPPDSSHALRLFEVMLSIALLSLRTCPLNVSTAIKQRFVQCQENMESLNRLFSEALKFKVFCERNITPIISVAQQCLWSAKPDAQKFGAKLYKELFLAMPNRREIVLKMMLSHIVQSETESEAVLVEFTALISEDPDSMEPFLELVAEYFFLLDRMTADNVKRFFRAIFILYCAKPMSASHKNNLNEMIPLLLRSADSVQQVFGVLAALMKMETVLRLEESLYREADVQKSLQFLDEARASHSFIRTVCYSGLAEVLRSCFGCAKCVAMHEWLTVFIEEFRSDFFSEKHEASSELESERYVNKDTKLWLKCSDGQHLGEAVPLLEAVMEAIRLQETWPNADTFEATQRDRWSRIFYTLSANVSVQGVDDNSKVACDTLYRIIQWIRTLFNVFSEEKVCPGVASTTLDEIWTKKFLLMFECQKELLVKAKSLGQWSLPDQNPLTPVMIVATEAKKKPPKKAPKRKRSAPTDGAEIAEDILPPTQAIAVTVSQRRRVDGKSVSLSKLLSYMKTLKLSAVVKLMELTQGRRRASIFLFEHLLGILKQVCPRVGKKSVPWDKIDASTATLHGDITRISAEVEKLLPILWSTFSKTVSYFRDQFNSSAVVTTETDVSDQLADLLRLCLGALEHLFSWNHISALPSDSDAVTTRKRVRRDKIMTILERALIEEESERSAGSEAEKTIYEYLIDMCEVVPNVTVAAALLDCAATIQSPTEELSNRLARNTLEFLRKEWVDKEGRPIKGALLTSAVRRLLGHYLNLRPVNYRLCAIQWILAKKLADLYYQPVEPLDPIELQSWFTVRSVHRSGCVIRNAQIDHGRVVQFRNVPHDERRKSKVYEQESDDPDLGDKETKQIFACFTRSTFGTIYKVLFVAMNDALANDVLQMAGTISRRSSSQECLRTWNIAAGCVSLFGLMLRVRELRSTSLLVAAIKEGRRFLALMCNKTSSFMHLLEDKARLATVTENVVEIIKSVQIGNRNFQNICVHAKANRSNILLKLVPDFRVTNEQWMRAIQSKLAGINCQEAFEIGLLKPRDINGEEIVYSGDDRSSSTCSESEGEQNAEEAHSGSDDANTSEVY